MTKLGVFTGHFGRPGQTERQRDQERAKRPDRKLYNTTRWRELRDKIRLRDCYTCQKCETICEGKGESAVDHRKPHRGNEALFWDEENLWLLCKRCHDSAKQAEERGQIKGEWY